MSILRLLLIFSIGINFFASCNLQKKMQFDLQSGDLLFQDLDADSISDAIESVTGGEQKLSFSHVGIAVEDAKGGMFVLEAITKGVSYTPIDTFLNRSLSRTGKPKVQVGRLKEEYRGRIPQAIKYGRTLMNMPYDHVYTIGDSTYYCSELIYEMFTHSGDSSEIFHLNPMTFKDTTGVFLPFWQKYYHDLGVDIPEGKPGLNPNGMSQSDKIEMVYSFYNQ